MKGKVKQRLTFKGRLKSVSEKGVIKILYVIDRSQKNPERRFGDISSESRLSFSLSLSLSLSLSFSFSFSLFLFANQYKKDHVLMVGLFIFTLSSKTEPD